MTEIKIGIIGLGYVGLPLCVEFAKHYNCVVGYDIDEQRINELNNFHDRTNEKSKDELFEIHVKFNGTIFTSNEEYLKDCNVFIVTVPTPIDIYKKPDLNPLISASHIVRKWMSNKSLVIYESTVFPSCTENVCIPILEKKHKKLNKDFYVGYSPERINPGDKKNTLTSIKKIVSGSNDFATKIVKELYESIGINTHVAPNIQVAEMSKAIENAQRDLNISFANEVALFCDRLNIDTQDVMEAASTKWNFLQFKAGLVGGHCLSVDPYYLIHKAEELDFHLSVIASGRRVNDHMPRHIASTMIKKMLSNHLDMNNTKILILGITFKENVPDLRNSKVIDVIRELKSYDIPIDVYDPHADINLLKREYNIDCINNIENIKSQYGGILLAVAHNKFNDVDWTLYKKNNCVVYDLKGFLPKEMVTIRL